MSRSPTTAERPRTGYSFTAAVVAEVAPHVPPSPCCRTALIEGMRALAGPDISCSRAVALRAALAALHQQGVTAHVVREAAPRRHRYHLTYEGSPDPVAVSTGRSCCVRSRLRGAFLVAGRVNRPEAPPHLEFGCPDETAARHLRGWLEELAITAQLRRQRGWRVVLRSSAGIGDVLSSIGAQGARLAFEEGRVVHEVSADVNRRLNAETANLARTVNAALRQVQAIEDLQGRPEWAELPEPVRRAAELRLRWPEEPLSRLAQAAGCSRAAMAARLGRLVRMAGRDVSSD